MFRRLVARCTLVAALATTLVALWALPASAHASLLGSEPTPGGVYSSSPSAVTLRFSEPVEVSLGGVRVFAASSQRPRRHRRAGPSRWQRVVRHGRSAEARQRYLRGHVAGDLRRLAPGRGRVHVPGGTDRIGAQRAGPGHVVARTGPGESRGRRGVRHPARCAVGVARAARRRARVRGVRVAARTRQPASGLVGARRMDRCVGRDGRGHRTGGRVRRRAAARQGVRPRDLRRRHRHAVRPRRVGAARAARVCAAVALVRVRSCAQRHAAGARLVAGSRRAGGGRSRAHPRTRRSSRDRDADRPGHPDGRAPRTRHGPVAGRTGAAARSGVAPPRHRRAAGGVATVVEACLRVRGHARRHRHLPGVA